MKRMPKITIDELATIVKKGFDDLNKKIEAGFNEVEELARMVKHGFDETATKKDLEAYATKADMQSAFKLVHRRFDELEETVRSHSKEHEICRKNRVLTEARLQQLESAV